MENILARALTNIEELRANRTFSSNLDWTDYEFGRNFFECVSRDDKDTETETEFICKKMKLKPGSHILDLGCGGGRNAFTLAEQGFRVTGIDLNRHAIESAQVYQTENKTEFICDDIRNISYDNCFDAAILIFNHFSAFSKTEAKKVTGKMAKALVKEGKVLIEIASVNHGLGLDGHQEWFIADQWLSGKFLQLILVENEFIENKKLHLRNDYCINAKSGTVHKFVQVSQLYEPEEINELFRLFGLKVLNIFGGWHGKNFEENDDSMIILGQKI